MAIRRNVAVERAAMEKRARDQGSIVKPEKKIGKEREGFAKKGLEAKGRFGIRKGIERVSPRIIKKAVKARTSIDTYHTKLERLSVSDLNKEYSRVAEKLKGLSKKYNKAKKGKKEVFAKQLRVLEETANKIKDLISSRRAADLERSRKMSLEQAKGVRTESPQKIERQRELSRVQMERVKTGQKNIGEVLDEIKQEFLFIKSKGVSAEGNNLLVELTRKIDIIMKTRVREMSKDQAVELDRLRDVISARARGVVTKQVKSSEQASLKVMQKKWDKEPPKFMFERFFELMKEPDRNAKLLDEMSKFLPVKLERTMMEIGNSKRSMDEKRQALGQLKMQIEEFMSDTTRRLQLLGRPKMLDVRYVKGLYNELRKYTDRITGLVVRLTPKQSTEGQRLELARETRARKVVFGPDKEKKYLVLVRKLENLVDKFGPKEAERLLRIEDTRFREFFENEGPDAAFKYLEDRLRHYQGLQTNLLSGTEGHRGVKMLPPAEARKLLTAGTRPEQKLLSAPTPEAIAEDAVRRGEELAKKEFEAAKKTGRGERVGLDPRDMIRRIERVREEVKANRGVLGKIIDLQKAITELTRSKMNNLDKSVAEVKTVLEDLKNQVHALDENLSRTVVSGIEVISDQMNKFLEQFDKTIETEGKLTRQQISDLETVTKGIKDIIIEGVKNLDTVPKELTRLNDLLNSQQLGSKEQHEEIMGTLKIMKEDAETSKLELMDSMSTIFDARLFEIDRRVKSLDENTTKVLQNLGLLEGHFLSLEHFDKVVKESIEKLSGDTDAALELTVEEIQKAAEKVIEKIKDLDPKFVDKLSQKMDDLTEMTVQSREDVLTVLSEMHEDLGKKLTDLDKKIDNSRDEILEVLDEIGKGTETDKEIKEIVEDLRVQLEERAEGEEERIEGIGEAFKLIADRLDELGGKLDANNQAIADILRRVIQEELNGRLTRMEGNLDTLVQSGATKEDTDIIQAQINELRELITKNGAGGGQGGWGPGGYGPGGYGPGGPGGWPPVYGNHNEQNVEMGERGHGEEGEDGRRPPREPGEREDGELTKKDLDKAIKKALEDKEKKEEKKGGAEKAASGGTFSKVIGFGMGIGIPVAILVVLVVVLSKIFGGGQTTTTSTVKAATVPIMPVTGSAAAGSSSFLPSGFMTPLIIILILVALFLLFPKNK